MMLRARILKSALANTVNLGIHVFNPHRFNGVLRELAVSPGVVPKDQIESYFGAAERCFQNPANLKLVGLGSVVDTLQLLQTEFPESSVYAVLLESVMGPVDSEAQVVQLATAAAAAKDDVLLSRLKEKLDLVSPGSRNRIALAELHDEPAEYLRHFTHELSPRGLLGLSETELAVILQLCGNGLSQSGSDRFVDAIEVILTRRISNAADTREKLAAATALVDTAGRHATLSRMCEGLFESNLVEVVDLLSPGVCAEIVSRFRSSSQSAHSAWNNLSWKMERDPKYLSTLTARQLAGLLAAVPKFVHTDRETASAVRYIGATLDSVSVESGDVVALCEAFNLLPGMPWVEHREFADKLFDRILGLAQASVSVGELQRLALALINGLELSDSAIVQRLIGRFSIPSVVEREHLLSVIEEATSENSSRVGNLVMLKLLSRDSNEFNKIVDAVRLNKSVPLHARLGELSGAQMIELVSVVAENSDQLLSDLEMIAHSSSIARESVGVQLELFARFAELRFPSPDLMQSIASKFNELVSSDALEFLHCCARLRLRPAVDLPSWTSSSLHALTAPEVAIAIEASSSLGMLNDVRTASSLVNRFLQSISSLDMNSQAEQSAKVLASLFVSLIVPSGRQLEALVNIILTNPLGVHQQDAAVITSMSRRLESEFLRELVAKLAADESVVTEFSRLGNIAGHPEYFVNSAELSQGFAFKQFMAGARLD